MTQIEQTLTDVTAVGFDTAPLIYFIEDHPDYVDSMREIIRRVDSGLVLGYSSVITLTEILTKPRQLGQTNLEKDSCWIAKISP